MFSCKKTGLVLEGGGMRGIFTAGVLDAFLENNIMFPNIYGISAGSSQAFSYMSKQKGRNMRILEKYLHDPRYLGFRSLLKTGNFFGFDFIFEEIPKTLDLFDYETFKASEQILIIGATNCLTGECDYYTSKDEGIDIFSVSRASCSLPVLSKEVAIKGIHYLDGGISEPIPIKKAEKDGMEKIVVVLTRNREYRKEASRYSLMLMKKRYKNYGNLIKAQENRHKVYNETLDYIERLETNGDILVIRPEKKIQVSRTEKNIDKLLDLYKEGYEIGVRFIQDKDNFFAL